MYTVYIDIYIYICVCACMYDIKIRIDTCFVGTMCIFSYEEICRLMRGLLPPAVCIENEHKNSLAFLFLL